MCHNKQIRQNTQREHSLAKADHYPHIALSLDQTGL